MELGDRKKTLHRQSFSNCASVWRFLRVLSELLRHTLAQLLNDCRCKVFFLSPNSMDDGHCDALGHKGTSRQTYNGEILLDIDQFEFS